jgi:hypothetical protein
LDLIQTHGDPALPRHRLRRFMWAGFPAAAALAASFCFPQSPLAAGLAVPWMLITWGYAGIGLLHWARRRFTIDAALGADLALILISIGGSWAFMYRLGRWPGGFEPIIALLTAVHFHYAGFVLPLVASLIASEINNRLSCALAPGVSLAALLLALGITFSPAVELLAAALVVAASLVIASLLWRVARRKSGSAVRWLLRVAGASLAAGAVLAMLYAAGEFTGEKWIDIPRMIPLHGLTMALGFALPALTGFWLDGRR